MIITDRHGPVGGLRSRPSTGEHINPQLVSLGMVAIDVLLLLLTAVGATQMVDDLWAPGYRHAVALDVLAVFAILLHRRPLSVNTFIKRSLTGRILDLSQCLGVALGLSMVVSLAVGGVCSPLMAWQAQWFVLSLATMAVSRMVLGLLLDRWQARGILGQTIAVVGGGELASRLVHWMQTECADSLHIIGVFDDRANRHDMDPVLRAMWRGNSSDLIEMARTEIVDRVVIALPHSAENRLIELMDKLKQMPADICLAPDRAGFIAAQGSLDRSALPLLNVHGRPLALGQQILKGAFDRIIALCALIVAGPILLAAAAAVRLESPGSVLFWQERYGLGGRVFRICKLRTMRSDQLDLGGSQQTRRIDARVTRIGAFLRRSSIDELPQIWNVLRGDMSIVGPRPLPLNMRVEERLNNEIVAHYAHRHRVKPGLTGWAQVNGNRGAVEQAEDLHRRVALDLYYIDHWSLWLDIKIIFMTFGVLFGHPNAY